MLGAMKEKAVEQMRKGLPPQVFEEFMKLYEKGFIEPIAATDSMADWKITPAGEKALFKEY